MKSKPAAKKKATTRQKPAAKRKAAPRKAAPKKTAAKRKPAAKKSATKRKAAAKSKPAAKRRAAPKKKAAAKKPAAKRKTAPRKTAAKKRAAPKKRAPAKRKAPARAAQGNGRESLDSIQHLFEPYQVKRSESYMNEDQKAHFREILVAWKTQLMTEVDRTVIHMQDEAAKFPDPTDRASQEEEFNLELKTRDRERKLIRKIDSTLDLIDQDDYGYCETCGVEIGILRLEARPTATQCIDCKALAEIKERQILGG